MGSHELSKESFEEKQIKILKGKIEDLATKNEQLQSSLKDADSINEGLKLDRSNIIVDKNQTICDLMDEVEQLQKLRNSDNEAWSKQCAEWMTKHEQIWNECLLANNKIAELEKECEHYICSIESLREPSTDNYIDGVLKKDKLNLVFSEKIAKIKQDLFNVQIESSHEISDLNKQLKRLNDFVSLCVNSYKMVNDKTSSESVLHIIQNRASEIIDPLRNL